MAFPALRAVLLERIEIRYKLIAQLRAFAGSPARHHHRMFPSERFVCPVPHRGRRRRSDSQEIGKSRFI